MKQKLTDFLRNSLASLGIEGNTITVDYPENPSHGDFTTNVAMANAKKFGQNPRELATKIKETLEKTLPDFVESVSVAGAGFINFSVKDEIFAREVISGGVTSGLKMEKSRNILIEHTDPNTFKPFHIGHLMANAIGESLSRIIAFSGDNVTKLCYPSDIGLHIAKSIWAIINSGEAMPEENLSVVERTAFLGRMYAKGTASYDADDKAKKEIDALNKIIYDKSDPKINALCEKGKKWSTEHFELLYKRLGTTFDQYFYESDMAPVGLRIVKENMNKVFEDSEGAVVFHGEKYGLHTRVFVNSLGLPTYETKELGLNTTKFQKYPNSDLSIVVTANEQNDYFNVLIRAMTLIDENIGKKTKHIGHGMLRLPSGKMSSRTGKVVTAEILIDDIKALVKERMKDREFKADEVEEIADTIAIAAIKYTVLRQAIGGDIIFDSAKSISFEGDSGPYLQYSAVRAGSILEKAEKEKLLAPHSSESSRSDVGKDLESGEQLTPEKVGQLEKLIVRFPDIVMRARDEYAPQHIAGYLISLAGEFNSFYAKQIIVDKKDPLSPYYVAVTQAFLATITQGLSLLGIRVPKKM